MLLACAGGVQSLVAATKTFTGVGSFSDATKWTGGTLPVAADNLIIDGACTVDNNAGTDNVAYGTLVIGTATGRTLNWAASGTNRLNVTDVSAGTGASTLNMTNGGTLIIRGTWSNTDLTFTPGAGTIEIQLNGLSIAAFSTYNNLIINTSGTISIGTGITINGNLTVTAGTFSVGAFSLAVTGTATVTSTLTLTSDKGAKTFGDLNINGTFTNTAANVPITIAGNLQNNGTFSQGTGRVTFTGATSNTVTGTAATTAFGGGITVNKGSSSANVLDVQAIITMLAGGLTLTNGTFKLSSASTITPFSANIAASPFLIPSTAGFWCNGGTISASTMSWTVAGLLKVTSGTLTVGNAAGNTLLPQSTASIVVGGGNLNLASRLSNTTVSWAFLMTAGIMTINTAGSTGDGRPAFNMDAVGCSFSMSGGTMVIQRSAGSAGQNLGFSNLGISGTGFTGGTLQIGNGSTPAASTIGITSTNAIYNLTVNAASSTAQLQTSTLAITNTVTISAGTLSANNLNLTVGGDWTDNVSTSAFTAGTATVTLNGASAQSIGGSFATTFNNLTISNTANTVTSAVNASVSGNLSVSSGTFNLGTFTANRASAGGTLSVSNSATLKIGGTNTIPSNYSTHSIGATSTVEYSGTNQLVTVLNSAQDYGHLTISGSGTKTLAGSVNVGGTLTFTSGTITTGASTLYLKATGTVARTSGHVIGNFQKNIATGATSKTFEVGDASNYTPVTVAFASVTTAGDLTASVASGDHANIGTSTINPVKSVNRNWSLTNSGIVFTTCSATFTFVAGDLDAGATTSNFIVGRYSAGWTYPTVGIKTSTTTQATTMTAFGDFQIGETATAQPNVPLVKSVVPSSPQSPGTDLVYTVVFTNDGGLPAQVFVVIDPLPANTDFKLASASTSLGTTGMTVVIAYSNNNGVSYIYTPVSAAGGAPAGYDRTVTHIRWTFTGNLSQTTPNNTGSVSFTVQIR